MYFKCIQLLRAIAAIYITLYHTTYWWDREKDAFTGIFRNGNGAIDLFFVISGFVLFQAASKFRQGLRPALFFLARRFIRIYPLYWIVLTLFFVTGLISIPGTNEGQLFKNFLLLPGFFPALLTAWTLMYEVYFYFLVTLYVLNNRFKIILKALFALSALAFVINFSGNPAVHFKLHGFYNAFVLEFLLGVAVFQLFKRIPLALAVLLLVAGSILFFSPLHIYRSHLILFGIPSAFLVAGLTNLEYRQKLKIPRAAVLAGDASYCLYLIHLPILDAMLGSVFSMYPVNRFLILLIVLAFIPASIFIHLYFEKPLLRLLNGRLSWYAAPKKEKDNGYNVF